EVDTDNGMFVTNYLLFIDDLKLLAENDAELQRLIKETKNFFHTVSFEMNKEKFATNSKTCLIDNVLIEGRESYKYLGVYEKANNEQADDAFAKLKASCQE
ncbi:hypothetical protein BDAP_001738, partial [Binucleata daphniae]